MSDEAVDFALWGSDVLGHLLAGLLAEVHGKRVALIAEPWSPYAPPRRFELSVQPATRPETWSLLRAGEKETAALLHRFGKATLRRTDALFVGEARATIEMLSHLRHVAAAAGLVTERVQERAVPGVGAKLGGVLEVVEREALPKLVAWLDQLGVQRYEPSHVALTSRRDGGGVLQVNARTIDARRVVLIDPEAVTHLAEPGTDDLGWFSDNATTLLVDIAARQPWPLAVYLDRDLAVKATGRRALTAIAGGALPEAMAQFGTLMAPATRAELQGRKSFRRLASRDGALWLGPLKANRHTAIVGATAFLAPALARHLAGAATDEEAAYFASRGPARAGSRATIADWSPVVAEEPV